MFLVVFDEALLSMILVVLIEYLSMLYTLCFLSMLFFNFLVDAYILLFLFCFHFLALHGAWSMAGWVKMEHDDDV